MNEILSESLIIGNKNSDYILIHPLERSYSQSKQYWELNWVNTEIEIKVGGFAGKTMVPLRTDEFSRFYNEMLSLYMESVKKSGVIDL